MTGNPVETFYGEPFVSAEDLFAAILPPKATSFWRVEVELALLPASRLPLRQEIAAEIIRARWISRL